MEKTRCIFLFSVGIILVSTCISGAFADGGGISRIVRHNLLGNSIAISPDGSMLAFSSRTPYSTNEQWELWVIGTLREKYVVIMSLYQKKIN